MYTLFLDTHEEVIRIALVKGTEVIYKEKLSEKSHSVFVVPMLEEIMKEAQIGFDAVESIVAVNGPGSFTGIRIGLSVVKALAYSKNIPVYLISSLTAILVSSSICSDKMAVIPDNKGFYISVFDKDNNVVVSEMYVNDIDSYKDKYKVIDSEYNVLEIVRYALKGSVTNLFEVKANYVKTIEVFNDRK